jgi:hypothetical protein
MTSTLPASSRKCRGSRSPTATQHRPSGRSHSTRTDRSTITSPTTRSRTQISPGIHGADQDPERNHSPPERLTTAPVQISDTRSSSSGLLLTGERRSGGAEATRHGSTASDGPPSLPSRFRSNLPSGANGSQPPPPPGLQLPRQRAFGARPEPPSARLWAISTREAGPTGEPPFCGPYGYLLDAPYRDPTPARRDRQRIQAWKAILCGADARVRRLLL